MAEQTFNDLNLHDSRVLQVRLSLDLDENDMLEIFLEYVESYDTHRTSLKRITFIDCRAVRIEGHLGHIRGNSIYRGHDTEHSELLAQTYLQWQKMGVSGTWKHFHLLTNTGTQIDIIASGFKFEDVDEH